MRQTHKTQNLSLFQ